MPEPQFHSIRVGNPDAPLLVFGHGWNRTRADVFGLSEVLGDQADVLALDFPGFGEAARPDEVWDTRAYAKWVDGQLSALGKPYVWMGHSFGGRVGLRLGAMKARGLRSLILVGSAGLKRERQGVELWRFRARKYGYQLLKRFADSEGRAKLRQQFSSADYLLRPDLQDIFVATVSEDQSSELTKIAAPTSVVVGELDTEAPPEIARRIHSGIKGSSYVELPGIGHLDVLTRSRQVLAKIALEHLNADYMNKEAA